MRSNRSVLTAGTFLLLLVAGAAGPVVFGQNPAAPTPPPRPKPQVPLDSFKLPVPGNIGNARQSVINMRDGKQIVVDPNTKKVAKDNQEAMNAFAKSLVYVLTDKVYYTPPEPTRGN